MKLNHIYQGDSLEVLKTLPDESIDLIASDPPYQLSSITKSRTDQTSEGSYGKEVPFSRQQSRIKGFMGKEWDVLPEVPLLKECLRVMKSGSFAFWLMTPRQDSQAEFISRLKEAGFVISFSPIYWTYASGFPKASNISKMVDKKLEVEQEKEYYEHPQRKNRTKNYTVGFSESKERITEEEQSGFMRGKPTSK